jgi:hypothetical protein
MPAMESLQNMNKKDPKEDHSRGIREISPDDKQQDCHATTQPLEKHATKQWERLRIRGRHHGMIRPTRYP